jgi:hypothetical protein
MTERINLEVPAKLSALPTVRRVLGGLGARLGYSLDDLEDLYLASEELLRASLGHEPPECFGFEILVGEQHLELKVGRFTSAELRADIGADSKACESLDLCRLLARTMDEVRLDGDEAAFDVVMIRRHRRAGI